MSDDEEEMPPMDMGGMGGMPPGMGGMDDEMSEDEDMGDYGPPLSLPEGVKKEILTEAPPDNYKRPKKGDEVTVHYVGTLEADGTEFDSSRGRGEPFTFTLGKGQVIKGWDVGVANMKKGELAKLTLSPEFGYGEAGSPPKIPANATLVFEVELISWASKDDLFCDEGVIKTQLKEGIGWKNPKTGDEVLLSVKIEKQDKSLVLEKADYEYVLGSGALGVCQQACDKALMGMKKGEEATLALSKDYADGLEGGATVSLTLSEMYETKDVSFEKNKTLMKKQVKGGEGYDMPKECGKCKLSVEAATDGTKALPGFTAKILEFTAGNGEVCDALEFAAVEMKQGERAVLTVSVASLAAEEQLGLKGIKAEKVVLTLELKEFDKAKESYDMSEEEKLEHGLERKNVGASLFKAGRLTLALTVYRKIVQLFNFIDGIKDEDNKQKAKDFKKICELNTAACYLKLADFAEAKKACDTVLKEEASNIKALYRRAQAELGLKEFDLCVRDCKRVVELDPQNKDVRALLKQAHAGQKEEDKKSKGLFANMCKALGKGPIPEPYKAKGPIEDDDMDDSGDEPMDASADAEVAAAAAAAAEPPAGAEA